MLRRITLVVVAVGLSQRLREADDRIVNDERGSGRALSLPQTQNG
jgi:hypothetical protein